MPGWSGLDGGWIYESVGQAATLLHGQPVTRLVVTQPVDLSLGSAQGPVLRIEVRSAPGSWAAAAPGRAAARVLPGITATATRTPTPP